MSGHSSRKAVLLSLAANTGIALSKAAGAFYTGSGSMFAEAIHSFADCGNQALLLFGMKRSSRATTGRNPMGYAREAYFWAMMVAVLMFFMGGLFSLYEGIDRILHPHPVEYAGIAVAILAIAVALEGMSLRGALAALKPERGGKSLWQWFKDTRNSELLVVTGEDIAALLGLAFALVALLLTMLTGNPVFDALGSVLVGILLTLVAVAVTREILGLVIGEAADPAIEASSIEIAARHGFAAYHIIALQHGHEVMLALKIEPLQDMPLEQAMAAIVEIEKEIRRRHPECRWIFSEPGHKPNTL